jgi:Fic family protein
MDLYKTPTLDREDTRALDGLAELRTELESVLRVPRRWSGGLRRTTQARAIRGSNSIEGYLVSPQDAVAAVDDEEPVSADDRTWQEIIGYRRVLTYVLQMGANPGFQLDAHTLRTMHFMLLEHELTKSPGQFRPGSIYVQDERTGETVYEGPDASQLGELVDALARELTTPAQEEPAVRAAMAHLNLVMIHPFRDGNGRMARALQTLVLAREQVLEPTFSSIEEWLGGNTEDYYRILALTGQGAWHPANDAHLWVKFNLRAHHMQAETLKVRFAEAERMWSRLDALVSRHALPERVGDALFDAMLGLRVRRTSYLKRVELEERTATRDLARLSDLGLLEAHGNTRGRFYLAGEILRDAAREARSDRRQLTDPYPWLVPELRRAVPDRVPRDGTGPG